METKLTYRYFVSSMHNLRRFDVENRSYQSYVFEEAGWYRGYIVPYEAAFQFFTKIEITEQEALLCIIGGKKYVVQTYSMSEVP